MPTPAEKARLSAYAARELAAPIAAYDQIMPAGSHPLSRIARDGPIAGTVKAVNTAVKGATVATKGATRAINYLNQDNTENSMPNRPLSLAPRGGYRSGGTDQDPDPDLDVTAGAPTGPTEPMDAEEAVAYIQAIIDSLPSGQRAALVTQLQQMLDGQGANAGGNAGAMDSRGRRASIAADSALAARRTRSFLDRHPELRNVEIWNGFRRDI